MCDSQCECATCSVNRAANCASWAKTMSEAASDPFWRWATCRDLYRSGTRGTPAERIVDDHLTYGVRAANEGEYVS